MIVPKTFFIYRPYRHDPLGQMDLNVIFIYDTIGMNSSKIVGFEWLDFSKRYQGIDHIDEIVSVDTKFDIKNTRLKNLSLRKVFDWAFRTFVQEMVVLEEFLIAR